MEAAEKKNENDVVVTISSSEEAEITELKTLNLKNPQFSNPPSPEIPKSTTAQKNLTQRRLTSSSSISKPKSRFSEPPSSGDAKLAPILNSASPRVSVSAPKSPIIGSIDDDEDEEEEEVYKTANLKVTEKLGKKKVRILPIIELILFVLITGLLVATLTVETLENRVIWGMELWKWCVLVLVIFCGRLFSAWSINVAVFLIERNYLLKKKVLYFVYGLRKSVKFFIWLCLILLAWALLVNRGVDRSKNTTKILNYVTRALGACLIGSCLWLLKTLMIKILASKYQCSRFFDRIQESIFHQYVVRILSGDPEIGARMTKSKSGVGRLNFRNVRKKKEEEIDVDRLKKMDPGKVSAWTMKGLVDVISGSGLSTISDALEGYDDEEEGEKRNEEIGSEWEAKAAAYRIFRNVAKPRAKVIEEDDLLKFMKREEVDVALPLLGAAETRKIRRSTLKNWLVNVYNERKALAHSLNDTKTAIEELNKLFSAFVIILGIIVWLLLMGLLTTQVLVFISSQLLLAAFMFGNAAKTVFEAIIFVFVMHPFDVGDRCVIDGVQMVVEEMDILTTVFLRYDGEKIFYPNSVLSTKPISNFYRSPEMSDSVEFDVHVSTSLDSILALKARIKMYLESKPEHWRADHTVLVKQIEDLNKMKMVLYANHTINFQNYLEKSNRRSELVLDLKKSFEELGIEYRLLPQEVQVTHLGTSSVR